MHTLPISHCLRPFEDEDGQKYKAFSRPITQWHCRHLVHYVILAISKRTYTDEQLEQWKEDNKMGCQIDGQHYTRYQATQLMRKIELKIRKEKDTATLAKASGDTELRRQCQRNIVDLNKKYQSVADQAGMKPRFDKTRVEGYRETAEDRKYQKELEKSSSGGKMDAGIQFFAKSSKDFETVVLPKQEYAHVMSEIATNISEEQKNMKVFRKNIGDYAYTVENNGFGNYRVIMKKALNKKATGAWEKLYDKN